MTEPETYSSLLEAFEALNERKRLAPEGLSINDKDRWKAMRRELELALFNHTVDPKYDTREFVRVPVSLSVRYWGRDELNDRFISIFGEGGLMVATVDPLPVGTQLDLEVELTHRRFSFKVRGEVVWASDGSGQGQGSEAGMGIRFLDLSEEQTDIIYELVDHTLKERLLERRRFARVEARLQVQFVYADGYFELETEDISVGGLFIATEHLLPVGERIRLVLQFSGGRSALKTVAEVARVVDQPAEGMPTGLGVRFVNMSSQELDQVREFLAERVAKPQAQSEQGEAAGVQRRRHARMEQRIKLRFQAVNAFGVSYSRDISSGGVFIQAIEDPPPMGSQIMVTLIHPETMQPLEVPGMVVRVVEPDPAVPSRVAGVGVAFIDLEPEMKDQLEKFLKFYVQLDQGAGE